MIPKIINYVWFGLTDDSQIYKQCMKSWSKVLPDFEIKHWGREIVDEFGNQFAKDALADGNYAYASDWARFYIINKYGGIYMDCDVQAINPIPKEILEKRNFVGSYHEIIPNLSSEFFGSEGNDEFLIKTLELYDNIVYDKTAPLVVSPAVLEKGIELSTNKPFILPDDMMKYKNPNRLVKHHGAFSYRDKDYTLGLNFNEATLK